MNLQQFRALSVDQIVDVFHQLHGEENKKRTVFNIWLHVSEHASGVGEALRKSEYADAFCAIARVFGWLCSFVARCRYDENADSEFKLDEKLSDIVWFKYPRLCSVCITFPCHCLVRKRELEKRKNITGDQKRTLEGVRKLGSPPSSLAAWGEMFELLYGNYHYAVSMEYIGFHFLEEVGEVSKSIVDLHEKKDSGNLDELKKQAKEEIADVFSWLFALVLKLRFIGDSCKSLFEMKEKEVAELSAIIWKAYKRELESLAPPK